METFWAENDKSEHTMVQCDVKRLFSISCHISHRVPLRETTVRYLLLSFLSSRALFPIVGSRDGWICRTR